MYKSLSDLTLKLVAANLKKTDYKFMTDKSIIRNISLTVLGSAGVCALTLLTSAQQAQAAPPDDDPTAIAVVQDQKWAVASAAYRPPDDRVSTTTVLDPDHDDVAMPGGGIPPSLPPSPPIPVPGKGPIWYPAPGKLNSELAIRGDIVIGLVAVTQPTQAGPAELGDGPTAVTVLVQNQSQAVATVTYLSAVDLARSTDVLVPDKDNAANRDGGLPPHLPPSPPEPDPDDGTIWQPGPEGLTAKAAIQGDLATEPLGYVR
ncbi:hypothetical protein [Actinoplanes subglobosus]|uniref:SAF domain-containing protein n=1 Tax=Actinoplanes subglobosus TaxID=1547892 RepID=A0ABV8IUV5_9ACTN